MSTTISLAFVKQFEREVHEAYQRQGSKLRGAVRTINNVKGSSVIFQKVGKGVASTKSTHVYKRSDEKKGVMVATPPNVAAKNTSPRMSYNP